MKQLFEAFKSARNIEILILIAMLCTLFVMWMGGAVQPDGEEARMERLLSGIDGAGKVSVMIAQGSDGEIGGVVVVSSGADDIRVKLELQRVVRTLTGLELEKIEIVKSRD